MRLGEEYNQDSITYNSVEEQTYYIIGTNKTVVYPGYHNEIALGKPMFGKNGEAYSKVHGRPFVFEEYDDSHYEYDCTRLSYNMSTIFMLKYNDTFILTQ